MIELLEQLSSDVRLRRKSLGLTQADLAAMAQVGTRFVHELEHGKVSVRLDKLASVLDVLGLELRATLRRPGPRS